MPTPPPFRGVLYISTLAADQPLSAIAAIAAHARHRNPQRGITGLLVFDGLRFGQQLEGPEDEVRALMQCIQGDPRHTTVEVLHDAPLAERRFPGFSLAYRTQEDALRRLEGLRGPAALAAFGALLLDPE